VHGRKKIEEAAAQRLGLDHLRPGQAEAVAAALADRDVLAVMSTGYGKSAIYQLAAALKPGPTLVVSPLIALQRDQVEAIEAEDTGEAAAVNAGVSARARERAFEGLDDGELEYLFLAPEQLANDRVRERIAAARPSLLVVDEAHCISQWGHDFRPEYLRLGDFAREIGRPTILALTATAAPPVRAEILERLDMPEAQVIVRGFDRPNIWLGVQSFRDEKHKREALLAHAVEARPPGIIYVATRHAAEDIGQQLGERGLRVAAYHAGLRGSLRDDVQERFMSGELDVVVATIAFGMGVDKADIRWVLHHDVSESIDAYWQEVGRAGRDGEPARALLHYREQDLGLRRFFAAGGKIDRDTLDRMLRLLRLAGDPVDAHELQEALDLSETKLTTAIHRLADAGAVRQRPDGEIEALPGERDVEGLVEAAARDERHHEAFDRSRVEMVRGYAEGDTCRRAFILSYFGEEYDPPCGNCDICDAGRANGPPGREPFPVGSRVAHGEWGVGVVQRYDGDHMVVLFDEVGYKTLGVALVEERGLLEAAD
jgi:ATP-dependent DNA helicase RecQ